MNDGPAADIGLFERVLSGDDRNLQMLAAAGVVPLEPQALMALQLRLRLSPDAEIAERACSSLKESDPRQLCEVVEIADDSSLRFLCATVPHPLVISAVLEREELSAGFLAELAQDVGAEHQEQLLLRQTDIIEHPEILERLEANPSLGPYARRKIAEYREHLLPSQRPSIDTGPSDAPLDPLDDPEVRGAVETAARTVEREGEIEEKTGLSEFQVRSLPVSIRYKLTYGATRSLRSILLRDNNPIIAVAAFQNSTVSAAEVEQIATQRNVVSEVLAEISKNRRWMGRYGVVVALVRNPRTPRGLAHRLIPRLAVRDLRTVYNDLGLPSVVRRAARQAFTAKVG